MNIWIDAQISPKIAKWISQELGFQCIAVRDLGLLTADDKDIFLKAKENNAVIITKDSDFVNLYRQLGNPPKIIYLTCGNTSNDHLIEIFKKNLVKAIEILTGDEGLVEISD